MSSPQESDLSLLSELVLGLASVALHYLGEITYIEDHNLLHSSSPTHISKAKKPSSSSSKVSEINLELAKQNIDFIITISEKTKGNLTTAERKIIDTNLKQLQQLYQEKKQLS